MNEVAEDNSPLKVEILYVGSILPNTPEFHTSAFSRAGSMYQENLLSGMKAAGLVPSEILSMRQIEAFPRSNQLLVGTEHARLSDGTKIRLLPFFNISPIKQLLIGILVLSSIVRWGWRTRKKQYRIVYTYNLTVPPGLFTLLGARLVGAKAFVSLNDINKPGNRVPDTLYYRLDYWLQRKLIPRFDGHIAVADAIMEDFAPDKSYVRIEGGISLDLILKTAIPQGAVPGRRDLITLVATGSLNETNGFATILSAFALLTDPRYRLKIAGGGPLANTIEAAAARDVRIEYCGELTLDALLCLYNSADILINMRLTKKIDTRYFFPSKMMEYLVSGKPVITTNTGHIENEFADFVYLLSDESPKGLAEMIVYIASLQPSYLAERGARARSYMCINKTWEAQGQKVAKYVCSKLSIA
jgi:glycosyltransferase involved in cell wall biosynthesis